MARYSKPAGVLTRDTSSFITPAPKSQIDNHLPSDMLPLSSTIPLIPPSLLHFPPNSDPPYKTLQDHPSLTLIARCKSIETFKQIHSQIIKTGLHHTQFALSKLIEYCAVNPSGNLAYALSIFETIEEPSTIIWNTIIRGYCLSSSPILAIKFYCRMLISGFEPNSYTFPFLFKSCGLFGDTYEGKQIHGQVLKLGVEDDPFVHTSIISMYAQNGALVNARQVLDKSFLRDAVAFTALLTGYTSRGHLEEARKLFDEIPVKDVVSWNAMIAGYARSGQFKESLAFFKRMKRARVVPNESTLLTVLSACGHSNSLELGNLVRSWIEENGLRQNLRLVSALIDMYSKCGDLETAWSLFDRLPERNLISWNVMIGGYTHNCHYKEALSLFRRMLQRHVEPNDVTLLCVLPACAHVGALDLGRWIHAYINRNFTFSDNSSLCTSLIDMYAKCGDIEAAKQVFEATETKKLACWNAMISGLAMHGDPTLALNLFSKMVDDGFIPDDITFVGVLSACCHAGLVDLGRQYFHSMTKDYGITPHLHHYGCVINLLGRTGLFDEAMNLLNSMNVQPDGAIWGSLLSACKLHKKVEFAEYVTKNLFEIEPNNPSTYILMSNIYAAAGRWDNVARIRTRLNDRGLKKVPGCTSIEIDTIVHEFLVGDKSHPHSDKIYEMLDEMDRVLDMAGYVADTSEVLYDMDEEWKGGKLSHHSERLAMAYGLISTKPGTTIRIVKNLRICENCHSATKLISKIYNREIIARDRSRFHRFKDGACSCNDYW